ncbi:MAG TPA: glycerophosphoryl diester phosphodiesterase membrane domain-containing protein [Actinotalea sp.]
MSESTEGRRADGGVPPETPPPPPGPSWGPADEAPPGYGNPVPESSAVPPYQALGKPAYGEAQYPPAPPQPPAPAAPQYGQPQYGQPQYGQPQYGQPTGYRPPPVQRGIIPLRPLSLGEIYDGAFRSVRSNPQVMFGLSAIVVTISALIQAVLTWYAVGSMTDLLNAPTSQASSDAALRQLGESLPSTLVAWALSMITSTVLTGLLIVSVSRSVIGQKLTVSEVWARGRARIWRLLGLTLLIGVITLAAPAVWVGLIFLLGNAQQDGAALAVGIIGFLGVIVWLVWIVVRTLLATPSLMLEEHKVVDGLKRGWALSRGSFWRLFGIYLLTQIIVSVVSGLVSVPLSLLGLVVSGGVPSGVPYIASTALASIVTQILTMPFTVAVIALLYVDTRMRKEGLDVELGRAAEVAAAGGQGGRP